MRLGRRFVLVRRAVLLALGAGVLGAGSLVVAGAGAADAAATTTLYVAPAGSTGAADTSCSTAAYSTIQGAVSAAASGDTIDVCAGTYHEMVTVNGLDLNLVGTNAVIDAAGQPDGVVVEGAGAAGSSVSGFTVQDAQQSGILVQGTSKVTVSDNTVTDNDQACQPQTGSNDCGEGLHLRAVTNSVVQGNTVTHSTGGILVTDGIPA